MPASGSQVRKQQLGGAPWGLSATACLATHPMATARPRPRPGHGGTCPRQEAGVTGCRNSAQKTVRRAGVARRGSSTTVGQGRPRGGVGLAGLRAGTSQRPQGQGLPCAGPAPGPRCPGRGKGGRAFGAGGRVRTATWPRPSLWALLAPGRAGTRRRAARCARGRSSWPAGSALG